ncbi:MAG: antibiotic biosynthesis monooxygenase [Actinomycetota bacterium]|nr:antibiotic biosynthesis monooxygenase [Actinomycetota bacterium]
MIIVAGALHVDPQERQEYLDSCVDVIVAARRAPGCVDFHLSADLIEPGRINVFEQWESAEAVEQFRGAGPSSEQAATILAASVFQHEVHHSSPL